MNAPDDRAVDEIFSAALALPEAQRERFVRERCAGDAALAQQLTSLLRAAQASDQRLAERFNTARDTMWRSVLAADQDAGEDLSGQRVNAWRLTRRLARGGLATVYLARRDDGAFDQVVAFKVMRRGLDTDDLITRFRAERQILSTLDHPSIAQIIDGGALEDGRPYLVLEYIDGEPITDYCRNRRVGIRGRLELVMDVLQALHHAHKHLVVHRDVKPSNILVSSEGHVSVLDFGIAKLLDPESMPGASTLTRTGVSLLTPGYGSPEQCLGQPVTTASDIYQVGVVLYELLSGERPASDAAGAGAPAIVPPSRLISDKSQQEAVRGDLDAITGKAMHTDPTQRYASALEMREDLQRYLESRPIQARPDTLRYRVAKLARRRPWVLPVVVAAVLAVTGYLVTVTLHARQLQLEQQRAQAALTFMTDLLRSADPFAPADPEQGSGITVVEALAIGVERLRSEVEYDPQLRASLLASIADVYAGLDQHRAAIGLRHEALELERALHGDASTQVLASLSMLAQQYRSIDEPQAAIRYNDEQLAVARRLYPEAHPAIGAAEAGAAALQLAVGDGEASARLYAMAVRKLRHAPAEYSSQLITALVSLSALRDPVSQS